MLLPRYINRFFSLTELEKNYAHRIRILLFISSYGVAASVLYELYYLFELKSVLGAIYNFVILLLFVFPIFLVKFKKYELAKLVLAVMNLCNIFIISVYLFSPQSGLHFYYFLYSPFIFLVYNPEEKHLKIVLAVVAMFLLVFIEVWQPDLYIIKMTSAQLKTLKISSIVSAMVLITVSVYLFSRDLEISSIQIRELSLIDPLTKLYNRGYFFELAPHYENLYKRYGISYSILFLDLDFFKKINDDFGHQTGDEVLIKTAEFLKQRIRKSDIAVRYGGEEFIILLPQTDLKQAKFLGEALRHGIEGFKSSQEFPKVTVSIGVSSAVPNKKLDEIIKNADIALYKAKNSGRNRVECFAG